MGADLAPDDHPDLVLEDVSISFKDRAVLSPVSTTFSPGDKIALLGPNGVGKTSLLRVAAGIASPTRGRVFLGTRDLHEMDPRERARHISYVATEREVIFSFTSLEFVLMALFARTPLWAQETASDLEEAMAALERLKVAHLAARPIRELSSGERQRVIFARTLFSRARIWLLDEPGANLDPKHREALFAIIDDHAAKGSTVVAAVHDINDVYRHFDRAILLYDGEVLTDGLCEEVVTAEHLQKAFGLSFQRLEAGTEVFWVAKASPTTHHQ